MEVFRDLTADEVREDVLPKTNRGVTDDTITRFLNDRELWIKGYFRGIIPEDPVIRSIVKDLAGASSWLNIAQTRDDREGARALQKDAMERLKLYTPPEGIADPDELGSVVVEEFYP